MFGIEGFELLALVILAVLVFGPDKLPKVIKDVSAFLRKVRQFSENAKQDIRSELGPDFKDFEFEDLNPKAFARKHLLNGDDDLGLKDIREGFDLRKDLSEVTEAVNDTGEDDRRRGSKGSHGSNGTAVKKADAAGTASLTKDTGTGPDRPSDAPRPAPFDPDAT